FRHKAQTPAGLERRLAAYAPIPGFSDPPLISKPKTPPLNDEDYNLWTIELADADVELRELWFQEYRFRGEGRARGGFRLQPQRDAQTQRCKLELRSGTLTAGPYVVANNFHGELEAELDRHDPRQVAGEAIFGKISLRTDLTGELPDLAVAKLYTTSDGLSIERGAGKLEVRTDYEHGKWREGSRVRYEAEGVTLRSDKLTVTTAADLAAEIVKASPDARVQLSFASPRVNLDYRGVPEKIDGPFARGVRVSVEATAELTKPQHVTGASAELHAVVPAMRWLNQPLEQGELFTGGRSEAKLDAKWNDAAAGSGKLELELEKVAMLIDGQGIEATGKLEALASYDPKSERGQAKKLELELPVLGVSGDPMPGVLRVRGERLTWQGMPPERLDGRFELTSETISPLLPFVISSDILRSLAKALVKLGKTRAVAEVERSPAALEVRLVEAKSGDVEAFGVLRSESGAPHPCGRWYVQDGSLSVGVVQSDGETSVKPLVSPTWWRERPAQSRCGQR
ncbi:MAG TPA: hypothetical protein VJR89_22860, partial [Polyangiales bacterium]|nr:hypothetical protein [Polyangiales bacterium]